MMKLVSCLFGKVVKWKSTTTSEDIAEGTPVDSHRVEF